jgi:hypothetical protein
MRNLAMAVGILAMAMVAHADEAKKYEVKVTPASAKVGQSATARFQIDASPGSHVSDEAPLKISLKADGLKLGKDKLTTADIVAGKGASPKFEIPFVAEKPGQDTIEAKATFIVCTKELCEREQEKISIPVTAK